MALVFVLFIASVYLLNKWLYQPILAFMDARDKMISDDLANASSNDGEIEAIRAESASIIESAKKEATAIKEKAILEAKDKAFNKVESLKQSNEADLAKFLETLDSQKNELKNALIAQIPEFKKSLSNKIKQI